MPLKYLNSSSGNPRLRMRCATMAGMLNVASNDAERLSRLLHAMSLGSIGLCITLWIRAKTIGEDERGNAERRALFVGLWPPMFWLIGDSVARNSQRKPSERTLRGFLPL